MNIHITKIQNFKKINNLFKLIKNSSLLSLPSLIGIFLALIAIPIHLKINGKYDYGNYIFFHFIVSFSLILNLGLNKIVAIELAKKKYLVSIINQSVKFSIFTSIIIFLIGLFLIKLMINNFFSLLILIGICISVIYLTLEGIIQGLKKFKILSGVNFFFYTLSLNIPSILLYFFEEFNYINLITLSLFIKITVIFIIFLYLKSFIRNKEKLKYNLFLKLTKYSKWYFLHLINLQIFDFADILR